MRDWRDLVRRLLGRGLTEESIADQLGVNQSTVSRWLTGRNGPRYDQGVKLLELLEESRPLPEPDPHPERPPPSPAPPPALPPEYGRCRGRLS